MKRMIKSLWVALATLSALLAVVSCVKALAVKEQEVNFDSSLTTEQSQIVKGDSTVTTQLLINEEEVDCPRPTKYRVSFTYDEEAGTIFFLGDSIQSGKPISLSSLSDLVLTYQAKKLVGNKVDVTVSNDAPKKLSKELVWNILADKTYWVKSEQEGDGEITITGCDDLDAVKPDTKLAVTAKPADGWELVALTANDVDILEDKSFVVTENTTVCAVFTTEASETYAVTLEKEGEGKVDITGADDLSAVVTGAKLTVTAEPADGWEVNSITANGKDITADKSFVVTSNTVVKVVFKKQPPKTYAVTLTKEGEGKVDITGADNLGAVVTGSKLTVTAEPADGWEVKSITANGKDITADKSFVVTSNTVVKVVFKKQPPKTYAVTLEKEGEGKVAISGADNLDVVETGSKLTVTAEPADGWEIVSMTANGVDILASKSFVVTSNTVVKVVFKKRPPIPDVPTPDHIPNEYDYQRNCSIKILMVDQDTVKLPIPVKQYKEYLNIEAVHVKENEIYRRVKFDFSEVALSEQSEGLFRCDFFYIDWSRVIRPFLQVQQKQPLRDYIFSHATVNAVGKAIDGTFRKDKIETLASSDPILASIPELAGSYVLTQLPLAHCSDRTNPLENYLEVICFFKRK